MPRPLQALERGGIGTMGGLELTAAPQRESRQGRGRGPDDVVVLSREVDRQLGMTEGGRCVASDQRQCGTVHLDRGGEAGKLPLVDDDHLSRWGVR